MTCMLSDEAGSWRIVSSMTSLPIALPSAVVKKAFAIPAVGGPLINAISVMTEFVSAAYV